jgi:hypothetical protein
LGTLLIAMVIIISGSAVAWVYVRTILIDSYCTNLNDILDPEDDTHATLGQGISTPGSATLDLGAGYEMGPGQEFTVFADGTVEGNGKTEYYEVFVSQDNIEFETVGQDDDQSDHVFTTPDTPLSLWRYFIIECTENGGDYDKDIDPIYGPEVDAIGWDQP